MLEDSLFYPYPHLFDAPSEGVEQVWVGKNSHGFPVIGAPAQGEPVRISG